MASMQWIRLWVETHLRPASSWARVGLAERGLFYSLLILAGKSNEGGEISIAPGVPYTDDQIAALVKATPEEVRAGLAVLEQERMITRTATGCLLVANWRNYQTEYERQRCYRGKLQQKVTAEGYSRRLQQKVTAEGYSERLQQTVTPEGYKRRKKEERRKKKEAKKKEERRKKEETETEREGETETETEREVLTLDSVDTTERTAELPSPPKRTALQEAADTCLTCYAEAYQRITGQPYPELTAAYGRVVKFLKAFPVLAGSVELWKRAVQTAEQAHSLSPQWHGFPMTIPKFCAKLPELNQRWLDRARAESRKSNRRVGLEASKYATAD